MTVISLLFIFVVHWAGTRRATYLYLDCTKNVHKNWNINGSFIIQVNFDHVWAEHYPVAELPHLKSKKSGNLWPADHIKDLALKDRPI